jgi:hypothetical protein
MRATNYTTTGKALRTLGGAASISLLVTGLMGAGEASAAAPPSAPSCALHRSLSESAVTGGVSALASLRDRIAGAATIEEARRLAVADTSRARQALARAGRVLPFRDSIRETRDRLEAFEARVGEANTQSEVADEFAGFLDLPRVQEGGGLFPVEGKGGCHYSKGEIIIVLIGLLFGILPGIIFLILLC